MPQGPVLAGVVRDQRLSHLHHHHAGHDHRPALGERHSGLGAGLCVWMKMGVSMARGSPRGMVYSGKIKISLKWMMTGGTPISGNLQMVGGEVVASIF